MMCGHNSLPIGQTTEVFRDRFSSQKGQLRERF